MTVAYRFVAGAAAVLFMAFAGLFAGTAAAQMPGGQQVELTTKLVEQIIASADDVRATAEGLSAKYGMKGKQFGDNPAGMFQAWAAHREAQSRAPGMLGRTVCEVRFSEEVGGLRIDVDVQAPLIERRRSERTGG